MGRFLILGAGMGEAVAHALLKYDFVSEITILDCDAKLLETVVKRLDDSRVIGVMDDVSVIPCMKRLMRNHDVVVSAVKYDYHYILTKAAIEEGKHFVDLGGNNAIVKKQFALDQVAKDAGSIVMPAAGIAPGAVNVLPFYGMELLGGDTFDIVRVRVGGLPQLPTGPLAYARVFSVNGLINEYVEKATILKDGELVEVESMTGDEAVMIDGLSTDYGAFVACYTSGVSGTLARNLKSVVRNVDYKTIRFSGYRHWESMRLFRDLGFFDRTPVTTADGQSVSPRDVSETLLETRLPRCERDMILMQIVVSRGEESVKLELVDKADPATGLSAMQRTTGFSAAIEAAMIARGDIRGSGVLYREKVVDPSTFVREWGRHGLCLKVRRIGMAYAPR